MKKNEISEIKNNLKFRNYKKNHKIPKKCFKIVAILTHFFILKIQNLEFIIGEFKKNLKFKNYPN